MARLADATDAPPIRRMSVVRGRLRLSPATLAMLRHDGPELLVTAKVAAILAAKDAGRAVPTALPVHLTDAFCDLAVEEVDVVCTMTVQGFARTSLEPQALAGAAAALLALWDAVRANEQDASGNFPTAAVTDLRVVQNVAP